MYVGDVSFSLLYCDVAYMDIRSLRKITALARQGLPVCLKRLPQQPGHIKSPEYDKLLQELKALSNVSSDFSRLIGHAPLVAGDSIPEYWCRVDKDGTHYLFLAQPLAYDLQYPIYSGQSFMDKPTRRKLTLTVHGKTITYDFEFQPYQSILAKIGPEGKLELVDINFRPRDPVIRPREPQRTYF
ncbi:MAG: hypothetical protein NZL95_07400, partial [Chitinophagales bacterium]|nr:hypothetical protein [Chitinophagales bacterium]MDW8428362.1 hypothetical protein [Chitinophagales bacterium]